MQPLSRDRWYILAVLFCLNALNFYDRQILGAVMEPIRRELSLNDTQIGLLSTAFTLVYAAVGMPLGRLADSWKRNQLLAISVATWSLLTAASGLARGYASLFATRLGVGIGEAACAPAANSLIGDLFPPSQRARALSIFMLGLPVGLFFSYWISGWIADAYGWRSAFYVAAVPGLLIAILTWKLREPARGAAEESSMAARCRPGSPWMVVLGIPTMWWMILSGAFFNFKMYAVNAFTVAFLARYHQVSLKESTWITAWVLGAVGVLGLLLGGWLSDRVSRTNRSGRLHLAAVSMLLAAPCLFLALRQPGGEVMGFTLFMGAGSMLMFAYYSCVYPAIQDVVEPGLRGTAMALYFFAMYVLGGSIGPIVTGALSDFCARQAMTAAGATTMTESFKAAGLHTAMHVIPLLCFLLAVVLFAAARTVGSDMEKLRTWMRSADGTAQSN
ncbi:MAG: MFS transporter [Verrucomicrobia bacterium]|nr:MFS transporter [Verrucomicrobiota bacterium]